MREGHCPVSPGDWTRGARLEAETPEEARGERPGGGAPAVVMGREPWGRCG